jgi:exopolysaccharide biosynthesis predicted pyruvyltransferase EpsI
MKVRDLFQRYAGSHVALLPNGGNCGDGLIYLGLRQLCADYSIGFTELLYPRPAAGNTLFALGCGNLCKPFHFQVDKIKRYLDSFGRVYLLPCSMDPSCEEVADFLKCLPPHATIFCRERYTFEKVRALVHEGVAVYMDHDLALEAGYDAWKQDGCGTLNAFRTDQESLGRKVPADNMDVSLWGGSDDGELLPRTISQYRIVHTDRAHVAICAAMLGKELHVYPNNYHKVRGIFEYSLQGRPNAVFHDTLPASQEP